MLLQSNSQTAKASPAAVFSTAATVPTVNSVALLGSYSGIAAFNSTEQARVSSALHVLTIAQCTGVYVLIWLPCSAPCRLLIEPSLTNLASYFSIVLQLSLCPEACLSSLMKKKSYAMLARLINLANIA